MRYLLLLCFIVVLCFIAFFAFSKTKPDFVTTLHSHTWKTTGRKWFGADTVFMKSCVAEDTNKWMGHIGMLYSGISDNISFNKKGEVIYNCSVGNYVFYPIGDSSICRQPWNLTDFRYNNGQVVVKYEIYNYTDKGQIKSNKEVRYNVIQWNGTGIALVRNKS